MQQAIQQLEQILQHYTPLLEAIPESEYQYKPSPEKWSKKEILGHLVDSALNNSRRFVVAQYQDSPDIVYNQNEWVTKSAYQLYPIQDLLTLWRQINLHILHIIQNMPATAAAREVLMGGDTPVTLEWCATDYCRHLLHHLHQLIPPSNPAQSTP